MTNHMSSGEITHKLIVKNNEIVLCWICPRCNRTNNTLFDDGFFDLECISECCKNAIDIEVELTLYGSGGVKDNLDIPLDLPDSTNCVCDNMGYKTDCPIHMGIATIQYDKYGNITF